MDGIKCLHGVVLETCDESCVYLLPCTYGTKVCTHNCCRTMLLVLGLLQPLFLICVTWLPQKDTDHVSGQIYLIDVAWNQTAILEHKVGIEMEKSSVLTVDIVLLALPQVPLL